MVLELELCYGKIRHDIKILFFNKKRIFITFSLASQFFQSIKPHRHMSGGEPHILQQKTIVGEFNWFTEDLKIQYLVSSLVRQ